MLIVNFKTYHESTGAESINLAKMIDEAAADAPTDVLIAVQALDLEKVAQVVNNVKVIAQHVDAVGYGAHSGKILPEEMKDRGAIGTLINHSECPVDFEKNPKLIDFAQAVFPNYTIVCTPTYEQARVLEKNYDPHNIAFEPPELIGGDISVSSEQPDIIKKVIDLSHEKQILVGAGVKTLKDVKISLKLGAVGILVASGVVKSEDPGAVVKEFLTAWL